MKNKYLLLILMLSSYFVSAQTQLDFVTVDKMTYDYYQAAKWDSLIVIGKQAKKQKIDYYYLNYRMGEAYFNKKNFHLASSYFQQALHQNKGALNDEYFMELLHLALVYSQRNDLAMDISLPQRSVQEDPMILNKFNLFFGVGKMLNYNKTNAHVIPSAAYSEFQYQDAVSYWGFKYSHQFNSGFNLGLSYSKLQFKIKTIMEDSGVSINESYSISQSNFALLPEFSLGVNWQLKPVMVFSSSKGYPYSIVDTINGSKVFDYWEYKERNFMFGLNVYRHIRNVKLGINMGVSNYMLRKQVQAGLNLTYYPFGNLNLYSFTEASIKIDDREKSVVFQQQIGFKTFSKLWVETGGFFGSLKNYSNYNLAYTYSIADNMDMLLYGKLIFVLNQNIDFYLEGQYLNKYTYRAIDYGTNEHIETKINYNQWNIEGGLLWKF